ncbi:MAG: glycosyltransferase family 2 protein, partial [Patescibacteria group bacterium]|nr:glycosyltransferase family 2 protein [Patescibacteria group bacterium]
YVDPFFKPNWSPDYLRSVNYITHFAVIKRNLVNKVGGFRAGYEGAQDWDLFLRVTRETQNIFHIPTILYSWRKSPSSTASRKYVGQVKIYAQKSQKKALEDDLKERNYTGRVVPTEYLGLWRVKYKINENPLVSIIIPTKDKYEYISRCLSSILKKTIYKNYELVIVDTGSTDREVLDLYKNVKNSHNNTQIIKWQKEFNFASVSNLGVEKSNGDYIVLLNNDTEVTTPDWLESMLEHAQRPKVGAVGCKLLYPSGEIQHAGVILGIRGGSIQKGVAGHAFKYYTNRDHGEFFQMMHSVRDYSAVTAACLMISKNKYFKVGGIDPVFRVAFNDVDFCLKLHKKGFFNVYTPFAVLCHHESVSVGKPEAGTRDLEEFQKEINLMHKKWGNLLQQDPFYNSNLTLYKEDFSIKV